MELERKPGFGEVGCPNCGFVGKGTMHTKGSFGMEVLLWLVFLVPGVIYSLWRLTTKALVCPKCLNPHVVRG